MQISKIGIFGVPRVGKTWPLFSHGLKGVLSEDSSAESIQEFCKKILYSQDAFSTMISEEK